MTAEHPHDGKQMRGDSLVAVSMLLTVLTVAAAAMAMPSLIKVLRAKPTDVINVGTYIWLTFVLTTLILCAFMSVVTLGMGVIRWALGDSLSPLLHSQNEQNKQIITLLHDLNENSLVSDKAKNLIHRVHDRDTLRKSIQEDIKKADFDAALVLAGELAQTYGYRAEAEEYREQILSAKSASMDQRVNEAMNKFDELITTHQWDRALQESAKLQRLFPESPKVSGLHKQVHNSREQHKHELEREFLRAAERDDIDRAIELLKELDKYLSEKEAAPYIETARGVFGKKRQNLGVQFKMAVNDSDWIKAVEVGDQVIKEFPNSKMADEVRSMIDMLRERAAGQLAAARASAAPA